jgi:hypothetical protein
MPNVSERPTGATKPRVPQVDLADPGARAVWLAAMRGSIADIIAAADDQTRPHARRDLGRREARRIVPEA